MAGEKVGILTERLIMGYGVDLVVHKTAGELTKHGFDVKVYCNMFDGTYANSEFEVVRIPVAGVSFQEYEEAVACAARGTISDRDVLIAESFPYFRLAFESGKPWIAVDHGVVPSWAVPRRKRREFDHIRSTQYETYFKGANAIVCVSNFLRNQLPGHLQKRAVVVYPGVDHLPRLLLTDLRELYGFRDDIILYLGRSVDTSPYKCTDELLKCYSILRERRRNIRLVIATLCSPRERQRLESGGALVLHNILPEFIPSVYANCDVFITATKWEGFDLPALEAGYFGRPVVAYRVGAHEEVIKHEKTGLLADTFEQFIAFVDLLLSNSELRKQIGLGAMNYTTQAFRWSEAGLKYASIISSLI